MQYINQRKNLNKSGLLNILLAACFLLAVFSGCKKADNFNKELKALPQISYSSLNAYKASYIVGDTMVIIGKLQPKNNLQMSIGGVIAQIIGVDSVAGSPINIDQHLTPTFEDRASILITAEMTGVAKEVKITSGGNDILGSPIDVYTYGGEGSFNAPLSSTQLATLSNNYKFFNGATGKGDVFYYAPNSQDLRLILKDGTPEIIADLSTLGITRFLAGGVDPLSQNLFFSAQLSSGYAFYKLNIQSGQLTALNQSAGLSAPYEGAVGTVQMIVTGIYPDSKGNLYLGLGMGNNNPGTGNYLPDAIARYNAADGSIRYVYKELIYQQTYPGMPGKRLTALKQGIRISPDENLLYTLGQGASAASGLMGIQLYDLTAGIQLQDFEPGKSDGTNPAIQYDVIGPFSALKITLFNTPDNDFGYLPLPGRRLMVLMYQNFKDAANYGFPKWVVFDFANKRTYAYHQSMFDDGQYIFRSTDQLLNYDESGNLYMTCNGLSYLIRTLPN